MSNNRSDDFDTMSFEPIRPGNLNYEQYFNKPIDAGDLSDFEDEPTPPPANNGYYPLEEDYDDPYENYSVDDDYYAAEPAYNYDGLAKGTVIAIAAIMGSIIIAVIIMFAVVKSGESNQPNGPIPYTTSTTTATTEATTSQVSTTQATTSTAKETTSTETETTSTTEATTTEATTEATTTTEAVTTTEAPTTQPPTTTQATTESTEAPPTTEPQSVTTPETDPGPGDDVVDLDPEIPGIQAQW